MALEAYSSKKRYEQIKKNPIFFCIYDQKTEYINGHREISDGWCSCDPTISFFMEEKDSDRKFGERYLFIIGNIINKGGSAEDKKEDEDTVFFEVEVFNAHNTIHWINVFKDCHYNSIAYNSRPEKTRQHCAMSLVWAIYKMDWNSNVLNTAYMQCEKGIQQTVAFYIDHTLYFYSLKKQANLAGFIPNVQPKIILEVESVLKELSPSQSFENFGFFSKIDYIINFGDTEEQNKILQKLYTTSLNSFIHYKYWKNNVGHKLYNYSVLHDIFSYVNVSEQMLIIKRYMHDVRMSIVGYDENIVKGFRDYKFPDTVDGRYYITSPGSNVLIAAPMFADAIVTLKNNNGQFLQTFNGILDLAIKNSNPAYPSINLGAGMYIPCCDGGLIPNQSFNGFIHFDIYYSLDESLLNEENLRSTVNYILQRYASRQKCWCCTSDNDRNLTEEEKTKCGKIYTNHKKIVDPRTGEVVNTIEHLVSCGFLKQKYYSPDRWCRTNSEKDKFLGLCFDDINKMKGTFTIEDISLRRLEENIRKWAAQPKHKELIFHNESLPKEFDKNEFAKHVIHNFYRPTKIRIFPKKNVFFSSKKSLLNLWSQREIELYHQDDKRDEFVQSREKDHVFSKTFDALKKICPNGVVYEDYIETSYNPELLRQMKSFFHYKYHIYTPEDSNRKIVYDNLKFLVPRRYRYLRYCTPKASKEKDKVSDLPFFWCGGKECFCPRLDKQTLKDESEWRMYTLYHVAEIIGYKLIVETDNGNVAGEVITNYTAELRQAEKLYHRLICRSCGHMIFSSRGSILNGSRYFRCLNIQCDQYGKDIYLSQCNTCKSGVIDSRDSKKCSNGWVICPHCLACCNDNLFQIIYNKHKRNGYVPQRIADNLGTGHNDKSVFFCPICGEQITYITIKNTSIVEGETIETESIVRGCAKCDKSYEEQMTKYSESITIN